MLHEMELVEGDIALAALSPFLILPRGLRDLIHGYLLIHSDIPIAIAKHGKFHQMTPSLPTMISGTNIWHTGLYPIKMCHGHVLIYNWCMYASCYTYKARRPSILITLSTSRAVPRYLQLTASSKIPTTQSPSYITSLELTSLEDECSLRDQWIDTYLLESPPRLALCCGLLTRTLTNFVPCSPSPRSAWQNWEL